MNHDNRGIARLLAAAIWLLAITHAPAMAQTGANEAVDLLPVLSVMDHSLSPGDFLKVQFYDGRTEQEYNVQVDTGGSIKLPLIGALPVAGMGLGAAAELITQEYLVYYKQPVVAVQLLESGQFEVFVYGPDQPGQTLQLNNGAKLLDVLQELNLTANPRYRRLHLVRGGFDFGSVAGMAGHGGPATPNVERQTVGVSAPAAVCRSSGRAAVGKSGWQEWIAARLESPESSVWVIDPLELTLEGNISELNIQLANHDVIYLPTPRQSVDLLGVSRSGRYELLPGETLGDILRLTGSHNILTDLSNTMVRRYGSDGELSQWILNLDPAADNAAAAAFELQHNDVVQIATRENRVFVLGEVFESGAFDFRTDATVLDYISLAKGHTPDANLAWIAIIRPSRNRTEPLEQADIVRVNFKEIHKGHPLATDIHPLPGDVIYVPPKGYEFKFENIVQAYSSLMTTFAVIESTNDSSN